MKRFFPNLSGRNFVKNTGLLFIPVAGYFFLNQDTFLKKSPSRGDLEELQSNQAQDLEPNLESNLEPKLESNLETNKMESNLETNEPNFEKKLG